MAGKDVGIKAVIFFSVAALVMLLLALMPCRETYDLQKKAEEWNAEIYAGKVSGCGDFQTVEEALKHFGLPGPLEKCRGDERRLIRFYDGDGVHGFLTCYPAGETYFCCAQLAEGYTEEYNAWKARCS